MTTKQNRDKQDVSLMAADQYSCDVKWIRFLDPDEQSHLLARIERGKRERLQPCPNAWRLNLATHARERMVEAYQYLVVRMAYRYLPLVHTMELLDLVQEGNIGLLKALEEYDATKEIPFRNVAIRRISQTMWIAVATTDATVRLPYNVHKVLSHARNVTGRLRAALGRDPRSDEVAREIGVTEEQLLEAHGVESVQRVASLQGMFEEDEDEDRRDFVSVFALGVGVVDDQGALSREVQQIIQSVLSPSEYEYIRLRYRLDEGGGSVRPYSLLTEMTGKKKGTISSAVNRAERVLREALAPLQSGRVLPLSSRVNKRVIAARYSRELAPVVA